MAAVGGEPAWTLHLCGLCLKALSEIIDKRVHGNDRYKTDMLTDDAAIKGEKRSLNIDPDLRDSVMRACLDKRGDSAADIVRVTGDVDPKTAATFEWRFYNEYQSASWLSAAGTEAVSVIPDASRIGNPAKDTMVIPCSLWPSGIGIHLPTQEDRFPVRSHIIRN